MPTSERAARVLLLGASNRREPLVRSSRRMANEIMTKALAKTLTRVRTSAMMTRLATTASKHCCHGLPQLPVGPFLGSWLVC